MNDTDKEQPEVIEDDLVIEELDDIDMDDASFGDDIIDDDEWDVDDFPDDAFDEEMEIDETGGSGAAGRKKLVLGIIAVGVLGAAGLIFMQMAPMLSGSQYQADNTATSPVEQTADAALTSETETQPTETSPVSIAPENPAQQSAASIQQAMTDTSSGDGSSESLLNDLASLENLLGEEEPAEVQENENVDDSLDDIFASMDEDNTADGLPMPNPISTDVDDTNELAVLEVSSAAETEELSDDLSTEPEIEMEELVEDTAAIDTPNMMPFPEVTEEANENTEMDMAVVETAEPQSPQTVEMEQVQQSVTVDSSMVAQVETRFADLEGQIASVSANIDALALKLESVSEQAEMAESKATQAEQAQPASASTSNAQMKKLEKMLSRLETRIDSLAQQKAVVTQAVTKPATTKKTVPSSVPVKKSVKSTPQVVPVSSQWVLRGALPGEALISKKGEKSLQTVHVGTKLSGLGTIKSIQQIDGKWVVEGTKGRVIQ